MGEVIEEGAKGREWAQTQLRNVSLRGERQPWRAGGGHQHRVREVRAGWPPGRKGWQLSEMLLRHPLRGGLGRGSLERAGEVGSRVQGPGVNGPGFTQRFLLLGWGKEIRGAQEPGIRDGTEWGPGESGGWK